MGLACTLAVLSLVGALDAGKPCARVDAPQLEWAFETKGKIYASPILADLDGDGKTEVIVCASRDRRVLCLDCDGELRWDYQMRDGENDGIQATPSVADYDGDGKKEVFFVTTGGTAACIDAQGNLLWRVFTGDHVDYSGPVVADVDNDGRVEVVFGSDSGTLYCLDDCGAERWHYQGDGQIRGIPAVARDDTSRRGAESLAPSPMRVYVTFGGGVAACLSSEGTVVWSYDEPMPRKERRSGQAVGDVDGDGRLEVVSATEDFRVIVCDAFTGQEKWRWKGKYGIDNTTSFALADFDGTGRLDVVCGDGGGQGGPGNVYRLRDGAALWSADVGGSVVQGPSVGDVDGDGDLEVLLCSRSKRLICLSSQGKEEWSFPSDTEVLTTPALGDIDGDGEVEIVFTSKDRFVRCVTVRGAYEAERMPWPMMNHDAQLSGNAQGAPFRAAPTTPIEAAPRRGSLAPSPCALRLDRFGPLHMGDNTVVFTFANNNARPRRLEAVAEVSRPDGSKVTHTSSERRDPFEVKSVSFDLPALFEGPYVIRVRLVNVGTGEQLASLEDAVQLQAFTAERDALRSVFEESSKQAAQLIDEPLRQRAVDALETARGQADAAIEDAAGQAQPSPKQRRTAIGTVNGAVRELRRVAARVNAARATCVTPYEFAVVADTTLRKVFRDEPYLVNPGEAVAPAVSLARNEYEGVQLVVTPLWTDLRNLRVSASDLTQSTGEGRIASQHVQVYRVGYVEIGPPEYNWFVEKQGFYPDILFPADSMDVPAEQDAQPFFVVVNAPSDAPSGTYTGVVRVEADGCAPLEVPLTVQVWSFVLPDETHLKVSLWMNEEALQQFYKYEGRTPFAVRQRFYDYHLEHRAGPLMAFPLGGGDRLEDFEYVLSHGQNSFFITLPDLEPAEREAFAGKLKATEKLLAEKGWDKLGIIYTHDEVAVMARHLIPKVVEVNQWVKTVLPDWPRIQTSAPEQSLFDAVDIWCPTVDHFDPAVLAERMARGDRLWLYTVWGRPGIMIEFPATDYRLLCWMCWKYGAEGFLYWGTTQWGFNTAGEQRWPNVPWIPYNSQPGHNGCGYLIYPGPDGTPLGSIRFELFRDGIEDYEYLRFLRRLLEKGGDQVSADTRARAEAELAVTPDVLVDHETFTEDPQVILDARSRIAGLIEELAAVVNR
jgi:outer membrane protein assembly factor BamB